MVRIAEMRVPLPMTVEEFKRGQRYANWKTNQSNTSEGQGGQLLSSSPYVSEVWGEGIFTHSLYRLGDRLPDWVTKLVPASALLIDEKTWMAYPHIRSVLTVPFFNKLMIEMISVHENDKGSSENILGLTDPEMAIRTVDMVDIAADKVLKRDYRAELDPRLFSSKTTGRGPLLSGWQNKPGPVMCAYKLVKVEANYWGVQSRLEKLMVNGVRQIVLLTHRNAFGYIDEWFDLTYDEICASEREEREKVKAAVKQPPIIDPKTGQECLPDEIDEAFKKSGADSEDSDVDLEFFETMMDWTTQEAEEFGENLTSGVSVPPSDWISRGPSANCAVCEAKSKSSNLAEVSCQTCNEYFCRTCFSEFHITPRLRAHIKQHIAVTSNELSRKQDSGEGLMIHAQEEIREQKGSTSYSATSSYLLKVETDQRKGDSEVSEPARSPENKVALEREPSWLEELSCATEGMHSPPGTNLSNSKRNSSYKVLNMLPEHSVENSLEVTSTSSGRLATQLSVQKKLSQHPNELSEEMVRSISSLYQSRGDNEENLSTSTSMQNFGHTLPQMRKKDRNQLSGNLQGSGRQLEELIDDSTIDPYGVQEAFDTGPYSTCWNVSSTPCIESVKVSEAYRQFRAMAALLQHVDPSDMTGDQRLAFWINVYNSLMMHAHIAKGIPRSHYKRVALMHKCVYDIGGHLFSALAVEHAILRACSYRPALASLLPVHKYKKHDPRQANALDHPEPLVSFALCCGSHSSPMVRVYTASGVQTELQEACRDFLTATVGFTRHFRVMIPKITHWYARDFSSDAKSLLEWIALRLPEERRAAVEECLDKKQGKKTSQRISVVPYDWNFRYLFDRKLTHKCPSLRVTSR